MDRKFDKPFLKEAKPAVFPYSREQLCARPIFPTLVMDCGGFLFARDALNVCDGDDILEKTLSGELFAYWTRGGAFDWRALYKDFHAAGYTPEWEGHIWISRLYILLPLAQAWCKTRETRYLEKWRDLFNSFRQAVPFAKDRPDDLLWRDMQVTWRTLSLVFSVFLLGGNTFFSQNDWQEVYDAIREHAEELYAEACVHAEENVPENHHLQMADALILCGVLFPEFFDTDAFIAVARKIIDNNLRLSIYPDGCNNEDSPTYSHFIARLYLEAELCLTLNGFEPITGGAEAIRRQYAFLYQFASPSGKTVQIGDSYAFDAFADLAFVNELFPLALPQARTTHLFRDSRMAVLRKGKYALYVDAMDMTEWHQHWGRGHFLLFAGQQPLVVDVGAVNYDRGLLREDMMSAACHNVIATDAIPLTRQPSDETVKCERFEETDECVRLTLSVTVKGEGRQYRVERTFALFADRLSLSDRVRASAPMTFFSRLFLPDCRTGYLWDAPLQPVSGDKKTLSLRFGSFLETVTTDTPFTLSFAPRTDEDNRMNTATVLTRRFDADAFEETTVIRLDKIR